MPSAAPTRDNDYQFASAPEPAPLSRAVWSSVMADIAGRLKDLEDVSTGIEQIQAELQQFGLDRLNEAIEPLIVTTQTTVTTLTSQVAILQEQFDEIVSGAVPADLVTQSASRVFVTPEQKAEIGQLRTDLTTVSGTVDSLNTSLTAAVNARVVKMPWLVKSANFTASPGNIYIIAGGVAVTFPTTVTDGDRIGIVTEASAELTEVTLLFAGKSFDGDTTNASIKIAVSLMFEYHNGAWRLAP